MVRFELVIFLLWLVIGQWNVECKNEQEIDWSLYQRLQTLQTALIHLDEYLNSSLHLVIDNDASNEQCIQDLQTIQKVFYDGSNNWANEMLSTWGKLTPVGTEKDLGKIDLCHDLKVDEWISINSQYCLARISARGSNINKIIPVESVVGICIPDSCAASFIANILIDYLDSKGTIGVDIQAGDCHSKNGNTTLLPSQKMLIACATAIFGLVILCSIYDVIVRDDKKNPVLLAFSAYTNGKKLFACKSNRSANVMSCIDGIRVFATLSILAHHIAWYIYRSNDDPMVQQINGIFNAFRFSLDTFFLMSALLASNKMLHEISTYGQLNIPLLYLQRIFRISPVLTVVALFNMYFIQLLTNGTLHSKMFYVIKRGCESSPWAPLLFYKNYNIRSDCVNGSWYLATDMQLYLLMPFLVILLQRYPNLFISSSLLINFFDLFHSVSGDRILNFEVDYLSARGRIGPWLIGIIIAYILFKKLLKHHIMIPKYLNILLLTASIYVLTRIIHTAMVDESVKFLCAGRIPWSLSIGYIIIACVNGQGGIINSFLSHPCWQPFSRLCFSIFLIHSSLLEIRVAWHQTVLTQIQEFFMLTSISCAVAVIVAITFEMPLTNLSHHYLSRKKVDALVARTRSCTRFHTILSCIIYAEKKSTQVDYGIIIDRI